MQLFSFLIPGHPRNNALRGGVADEAIQYSSRTNIYKLAQADKALDRFAASAARDDEKSTTPKLQMTKSITPKLEMTKSLIPKAQDDEIHTYDGLTAGSTSSLRGHEVAEAIHRSSHF